MDFFFYKWEFVERVQVQRNDRKSESEGVRERRTLTRRCGCARTLHHPICPRVKRLSAVLKVTGTNRISFSL